MGTEDAGAAAASDDAAGAAAADDAAGDDGAADPADADDAAEADDAEEADESDEELSAEDAKALAELEALFNAATYAELKAEYEGAESDLVDCPEEGECAAIEGETATCGKIVITQTEPAAETVFDNVCVWEFACGEDEELKDGKIMVSCKDSAVKLMTSLAALVAVAASL